MSDKEKKDEKKEEKKEKEFNPKELQETFNELGVEFTDAQGPIEEIEVVDPVIIIDADDSEDVDFEEDFDEEEAEEEAEELRDVIFAREIPAHKFKGDTFEYQKEVLMEYVLTEFAEKRLSVVTEGDSSNLTTKIVRN